MTTRRPFQFSIAMLLALTAVVAVIIWALISEPTAITGTIVAVLVAAFPALSITGCVNTKRYGRAFWIGTTCVSTVIWVFFYGSELAHLYNYTGSVGGTFNHVFGRANSHRPSLLLSWGLMIIVGVLCVAFRWLLLRNVDTEDRTPTDHG